MLHGCPSPMSTIHWLALIAMPSLSCRSRCHLRARAPMHRSLWPSRGRWLSCHTRRRPGQLCHLREAAGTTTTLGPSRLSGQSSLVHQWQRLSCHLRGGHRTVQTMWQSRRNLVPFWRSPPAGYAAASWHGWGLLAWLGQWLSWPCHMAQSMPRLASQWPKLPTERSGVVWTTSPRL